jgi:ABC-type multidrug transport system ATPase subunit
MFDFNINQLEVSPEFSLQKINGNVPANSVVAIIGENGSGKSTLLNCFSLKIENFIGELTFGAKPIFKRDHVILVNKLLYYKGISYFSQSALLWPTLNVEENIFLSPETDLSEARDLIEIFELGQLLKKKAWQLSGGEKQRASLVRSLSKKAKLYLLDEPTNALSFHFIDKVINVIREKKKKSSVVLISHLPKVVTEVADGYFFLDGGRLLDEGKVIDLSKSKIELVRKWISYS